MREVEASTNRHIIVTSERLSAEHESRYAVGKSQIHSMPETFIADVEMNPKAKTTAVDIIKQAQRWRAQLIVELRGRTGGVVHAIPWKSR